MVSVTIFTKDLTSNWPVQQVELTSLEIFLPSNLCAALCFGRSFQLQKSINNLQEARYLLIGIRLKALPPND